MPNRIHSKQQTSSNMGITSRIKTFINKKIVNPAENKRGWFNYMGYKVFFPYNADLFQRVKRGEKVYEHGLVKMINRQLKNNTFYFDVGANIGLLAIPFLNYNKTISVVSFEPSPNTFGYLQKTAVEGPDSKRWFTINKAIAEKKGTLSLNLAAPAMGSFDSLRDTKRIAYTGTATVEVITIDDVWEEFNKPEVCVIKIDTEGADLLGLYGAVNCINTNKPFIVIEWNRINIAAFNITEKMLIDFCRQINYGIYSFPYMQKLETETPIQVFVNFHDTLVLIPN